MRHERHYTLEEANAALPAVVELIETLRAARDRLGDRDARDALAEATPTNGGGEPARTVAEGFLGVREGLLELQDKEIVLRDLDVLPLPDGGYRIWYEARLADESHELRTELIGKISAASPVE